jgi:hypothetical protein
LAYQKQLHKDQAMRSMQLNGTPVPSGFQPHTPNMSSMDAPSPATLPIGVGQSPRTMTAGPAARAMQRDQSKTGTMLPPQSPVTVARANTPKPNASGKTPKTKDDGLVSEQLLSTLPSTIVILLGG